MNFAVFAYNFPHWKTQAGLFNLVMHGFKPDAVILQDKKVLDVPESKYRITPKDEFLLQPKDICEGIGLNYTICNHDDYRSFGIDFAVILGARILSFEAIHSFPKGILNIHPGILPGNRGLDNLKHSLLKGLPVGVTAHFIDARIDMGHIVWREEIKTYDDDTIRDLYLRQRDLQIKILMECMFEFKTFGIDYSKYLPCAHSEKFGIVTEKEDRFLQRYFKDYKTFKEVLQEQDSYNGKHTVTNY